MSKRVFQESLSKKSLSNLSPPAVELLSTIAYEVLARITEEAIEIRGTDERVGTLAGLVTIFLSTELITYYEKYSMNVTVSDNHSSSLSPVRLTVM